MRRTREGLKLHGGKIAVAVITLMLICVTALAATYPYTTTTNAKVNMRRSASSSAAVLEKIPAGAAVEVTGVSGNYYKVRYNNRTGYVVKQYLNDAPSVMVTIAPVVETTAEGYPYQTTTNDQVNLRAEKSTSSRRLTSIPEGATVTVTAVSGSYADVTYNGISGYCLKKYLNLKTIVKPTATPTPAPTLSPLESTDSYVVLQVGSTGNRVQALQEALIELGFLNGKADGVFGSATQAAVMELQTMNDYPATGVADENLQAHIYSGKPKNSKGVKTDVKTLAPITGINIYLHDQGQLVKDVQTRLKEKGYYAGDITGVYDSKTRSAVISFQKASGLQADGICGPKTQMVLLGTDTVDIGTLYTAEPTAEPTPVPTFQIPSGTVRRGDTGENVRLVQQRLIDLGYLNGRVDGVFGSASQKALQTFQEKHGLKVDGAAGPATYAVLFSYTALAADAMPTPKPTSVPTVAPATATPTPAPITRENVVLIREGTTHDAVRRLQERLTQLGYYNATMDGVCKLDDVAAIRVFQRYNGLTEDGVAGYDTQVKLYSLTAVTFTGDIAGGTVDTFATLRKGMKGELVTQMQQRLIALGYLAGGSADGNYGTKTAEAVYAFQKANGLVRDGVAGSKTLSKLYGTSAAAATPTPTSTPAVNGDTTIQLATNQTLRKGDINSSVKAMQQRLIQLGYLSGKADGNFGAQTYSALLAFQRANALTADGIAGRLTLNALNSNKAQATGASSITPAPTMVPAPTVSGTRISASNVQYANWYSVIRAKARTYPYATVYDFETGISWQVHMFSLGAHADSEPLTAADTAKMEQAFGGNTWNPKAVWVVFGNGEIFIASTHSYPHEVQHITSNNFPGHLCIHFPRTQAQVTAIGTYATSHQKEIDDGWVRTQDMR